jgi:hypothetical protein
VSDPSTTDCVRRTRRACKHRRETASSYCPVRFVYASASRRGPVQRRIAHVASLSPCASHGIDRVHALAPCSKCPALFDWHYGAICVGGRSLVRIRICRVRIGGRLWIDRPDDRTAALAGGRSRLELSIRRGRNARRLRSPEVRRPRRRMRAGRRRVRRHHQELRHVRGRDALRWSRSAFQVRRADRGRRRRVHADVVLGSRDRMRTFG